MLREFNFDGLIGPTHNYAGLSYGNVASATHRHQSSMPRAAALQGLSKMKAMHDLGIGQAILPPLRRPCFDFLRVLGMSGTESELVDAAYRKDPALLATCYSASNMWTANAATVSPSPDTRDQRLHLTVANLSTTLHRSIEHPATFANLDQIFGRDSTCHVAIALPSQPGLADEGAANHTRLCPIGFQTEGPGLELFVYGSDPMQADALGPRKFPSRQTRLASEAIAMAHGLNPDRTILIQQNPLAIDAGVFHNDVIAVGHQNILMCHELAFVDQQRQLATIRQRFEFEFEQPLFLVEFKDQELPLKDAVSSYLFNSQLVTRPDGKMTLVCPTECQSVPTAFRCTERLLAETNPIDQVLFFDLRQSMNNGGGPACLRLRVGLTVAQQAGIHQGVIFDQQLHESLVTWVKKHYREELSPDDLRDPQLPLEVASAFEELNQILDMNCA